MELDKITDAELEVLNVLWGKQPLTAREIIEKIKLQKDWNDKTVRTLITRLYDKEILDVEKGSKEYLFSTNVSQEQYRSYTRDKVAKKLFNGSISSMLLNFMEESQLSKEDVDELKEFLNSYDK